MYKRIIICTLMVLSLFSAGIANADNETANTENQVTIEETTEGGITSGRLRVRKILQA